MHCTDHDLDVPGTPSASVHTTLLSSIHDRNSPSCFPVEPEESVPLPANCFSISSVRRMIFGAYSPSMNAFAKFAKPSLPYMSAHVSVGCKNVRPGRCETIVRFLSHSCGMSSLPVFLSRHIAVACSAGNAGKPTRASVACFTTSAFAAPLHAGYCCPAYLNVSVMIV